MADLPTLLTMTHIYVRSGLSESIIGRAQSLKLRRDVISGPDDDYRSEGILFEVRPYGSTASFPMYSHVFR